MTKVQITKNAYYDSVSLMLVSKDVKNLDGIEEALVGMGTDLNKEIAQNIGLYTSDFDELTSNDFFVAVSGEESALDEAIAKTKELLNAKKATGGSDYFPASLDGAIKVEKDLNLALISIPGKYAAALADKCIDKNMHVMIFSDNVTVEEEKALKDKAYEKGLLVMGPDCGTAIINNVPLAFANVVKKGDIGIVAASGTGTQEVSTIIDQLGCGVSQVIGTGGRDLKLEIGGKMMLLGLEALIADEGTKVITLISKPPAQEIANKILKIAKECTKPVVVCFIGGNNDEIEAMGFAAARTLEDAAHKAVAYSKGLEIKTFDGFSISEEEAVKIAKNESEKFKNTQKYLRGMYTGGTLCDETMKLLANEMDIYSNIPLKPEHKLSDVSKSKEHTCLDFGDDEFTVGRPHPMIDPSLRSQRIIDEADDEETAVLLTDCVIGYGAHEDPASDLALAIVTAKENAQKAGRYLSVVVSVCGTDGDPQNLTNSRKTLAQAGAVVMNSNAQAARMCKLILGEIV